MDCFTAVRAYHGERVLKGFFFILVMLLLMEKNMDVQVVIHNGLKKDALVEQKKKILQEN
jgi:hypothetical protein